jgi:hypothetical protein
MQHLGLICLVVLFPWRETIDLLRCVQNHTHKSPNMNGLHEETIQYLLLKSPSDKGTQLTILLQKYTILTNLIHISSILLPSNVQSRYPNINVHVIFRPAESKFQF